MSKEIEILKGYTPGIIWRVAQMHEAYYTEFGFDHVFECRFGNGLAEFIPRLKKPCNEIWRAFQDNRVIGFVALDSEDLGNGEAHFRWFIVDEDADCRSDVGLKLLTAAVTFCDANNIQTTQIWIYKNLKPAQEILRKVGFSLTQEWPSYSWGIPGVKQQYTRERVNLE